MNSQADRQTRDLLIAGLRGKGAHLSLETAVANFPESLMNERPPNVPYTFWHQLEHIRIAQEDLYHYSTNSGAGSPPWPEGYWPKADATADTAEWERTVAAIQADRDRFIALLDAPTTDIYEAKDYMDGGSIFRAALLAIDHTAYHIGEFVMGRQILGHWSSRLDQ
ncbi:MAG: DinB family protein [Spirochaetales bacterium]